MKPIAWGAGSLPECVEGKRHVFAPEATTCRCGKSARNVAGYVLSLGWITTPREPTRKEQIA